MRKYAVTLLVLTLAVGGAFGFAERGVVTEVSIDTITIADKGRTVTYPFSVELLTGTASIDRRFSEATIIDIKKGDQVDIEVVGPAHDLVCERIRIIKPALENDDRKD